jgi:hypothetical protein
VTPAFRRFAAARVVSWAGQATSLVALPVLVYELTGSAALTALLAALEAAPYLCFGLLAGAWGDRVPRRATMQAAGLLSSVLVASVPVAASLGALRVVHVLVVVVGVGVLGVFADAAGFGGLAALVGRDAIAPAQGFLTTAGTVVAVAGPALGGVLVGWLGAAAALWVEAGAHLLGAVLLAGLALGGGDPATAGESVWRSVRGGLDFVLGHPLVRGLTLGGIGLSLAGGAVGGVQVVLAVEELAVPTSGPRLGVLFTAAACGSALAGVVTPWVQRRWGAGTVAARGYAVAWVAVVAVALAPTWVALAAALAAYQLVATLVIVNGIVARQRVAPDALQSRVNATARMIAWGGQPLGAAVAAALVGSAGPRAALLCVSGSLLVATAWAARTGLARLSPAHPTARPRSRR